MQGRPAPVRSALAMQARAGPNPRDATSVAVPAADGKVLLVPLVLLPLLPQAARPSAPTTAIAATCQLRTEPLPGYLSDLARAMGSSH